MTSCLLTDACSAENVPHIPFRKCVVCGGLYAKAEMLKFYCLGSGKLGFGGDVPKPGKGIYLCRKTDCAGVFLKKKNFRGRLEPELEEVIRGLL